MHCVGRVKQALDALPGVAGTEVAVGVATVKYDETKLLRQEIGSAIVKAGYKVSNG